MSHSSAPIPYAQHQAWFEAALSNSNRRLVMADTSVPVGVVRFDRDGNHAVVSINIAPEMRGRGLGAKMLLSTDSFVDDWGVTELIAEIKPSNLASLKIFERAGYRLPNDTAAAAGIVRLVRPLR